MNRTEKEPLLKNSVAKYGNGNSLPILPGPPDKDTKPPDKYTKHLNLSHPLTFLQKLSYGLGHVYNDLCASMWFSYTLLFFQSVLQMESATAGSMMLLGQVMDAIATPIIGFLADRWGSKRIWHLAGTAFVLFSFPMIFSRCLGCWLSSNGSYLAWWQPLYYAVVIMIFQCGWAVVQISHLAMIPTLTNNLKERSELTAIRYMASVCSGVTVYLITWGILHLDQASKTTLGPADDHKFRNISLFVTGIGCFLSIVFHFGIRQQIGFFNKKLYTKVDSIEDTKNESIITVDNMDNGLKKSSKNILTSIQIVKINLLLSPLLYQVAILYVAARLFNALGLVYMPLYLEERLSSSDSVETIESIASVPLASYISSFVISIVLKYRGTYFNHKTVYLLGSVISISACVWIAISLGPSSGPAQLYSVAVLLGMGGAITMVTSLCITADLIGPNSEQGAVVYSVVTFADKLITGIAVVLIEKFKCEERGDCPDYYRNVLAYVCGGSAVLGIGTLLIWKIFTIIKEICNKKIRPT